MHAQPKRPTATACATLAGWRYNTLGSVQLHLQRWLDGHTNTLGSVQLAGSPFVYIYVSCYQVLSRGLYLAYALYVGDKISSPRPSMRTSVSKLLIGFRNEVSKVVDLLFDIFVSRVSKADCSKLQVCICNGGDNNNQNHNCRRLSILKHQWRLPLRSPLPSPLRHNVLSRLAV